MSFAKQHGVVKNIKNFFTHLLHPQQKTASSGDSNKQAPPIQEASTKGGQPPHSQQENFSHQSEREKNTYPGAELEDMDHWFPSSLEEKHEPNIPDPLEEQPESSEYSEENYNEEVREELIAGGFYALQEQAGSPYWLTKVIYAEEQIIHVVCYAEHPDQLPDKITEQDVTIHLNKENSTFGIAHLPLPKADFIANAILLGQSSVSEEDLAGYRLYVDSVFDCLDEQSPDWLKKAGSYAAWRYDHNAMAALVDRYLIGVDLPRDSKKSLYWINRLVYASRGLVQPGETVTHEDQILTGGIYACPQEDGRYHICKVVLQDKHGVQQLDFPSLLGQLPENSSPALVVEQASARRAGKPPVLSHASLDASGFLAQSPLFLGLLPVTPSELHCYRSHLRKMFDGAEFQNSAWEILQNKAAAGDVQAQMEVAYRYIDGDPLWEVKKNIPEAIPWFTEAANQGYGLAAYNLAVLFQQGEDGVTPDPQLGFEWLVYAAQLNYGIAQLRIADCYHMGNGCPANGALAHAWYAIALQADNDLPEEGKTQAKRRKNEIETTSSPEQMTEAQQYLQQLQESF